MNILGSISGGTTSSMMAYILETSEKYKHDNIVYAFANTSRERQETIDFLLDMQKHWGIKIYFIEGVYSLKMGVGVKHRIVEPQNLQMKGLLYYKAILHKNKGIFKGLPFQDAPYCSEMLKVLPLKSFAKEYFNGEPFITSIGFRYEDMPKRISFPEIKEIKDKIYPIITDFEQPLRLSQIHKFFILQPFKLNLDRKKGNCRICWKKSNENIVEILKEDKSELEFEIKLEKKFGNTSYRNNKSIEVLEKISQLLGTQTKLELFTEQDTINDICVCNF